MFWLFILATKSPLWAAENTLSSDTPLSAEGYFVLDWSTDYEQLTLQQSESPAFQNSLERIIPGSGQITITGLADGDYHFRLNRNGAVLGDSIMVSVQHHSMTRALLFFFLGLALFLTLLATIAIGSNRVRT